MKHLHGGKKVIVRSNNCESPYWIGTYQGKHSEFSGVSVVTNDKNEQFLVCGLIFPYSEALVKVLDTLNDKEQWDLFLSIKRFWSDLS